MNEQAISRQNFTFTCAREQDPLCLFFFKRMGSKQVLIPIGDQLTDVLVTKAELDAARNALRLNRAVAKLEWRFRPFERLVSQDPPLWLPDPSALTVLEAKFRKNGDVRLAQPKLQYVWRGSLGFYELHEYVNSQETVRLTTVEVRTDSPIYSTSVLSRQDVTLSLDLPRGHVSAETPATWLLFDMDSVSSTRRALLPIIRACEALAEGLSAWMAKYNANQAFGLSVDADAAGRSVQWGDHPLGAQLWNACNAPERDALMALIAPTPVALADPKNMLKLELHTIGTAYFDPKTWSVPSTLAGVFDRLEPILNDSKEVAFSRTRALFVQGSILSDHPAPSLRLLYTGSTGVQIDLGAEQFRRTSVLGYSEFNAPLNLYVLAYTNDAQASPVAVFAIHTLPYPTFPERKFTEADGALTIHTALPGSDPIFRPKYDANDSEWMSAPTGIPSLFAVSVRSIDALVNQAAYFDSNTALATPIDDPTTVADLAKEWGEESVLLTVEERKDPQLSILLGINGWPDDKSFELRSTPEDAHKVSRGRYDPERTGLRGRRIRTVEAIHTWATTPSPFSPVETPVEQLSQSELEPDSVMREETLKAMNSIRLLAGNTDTFADTLPDWGRPYEPDEPARPRSDKTLALDVRATKYARMAGTAYPKQPSFLEATTAARTVERLAAMTYEQWMEANPVMRDALFDPDSRTTSRPAQVELDTYIKRLAVLLSDPKNSYDPAHHQQASLVGGRLRDSLAWLRMLEGKSGAVVPPQWLLRPMLITLQPDAILERYANRYPHTGLGWAARKDIQDFHLPKIQAELLKTSDALVDTVSKDLRKWATEGAPASTLPSKLLPEKPQARPPILIPFVPRPPGVPIPKPGARPGLGYDPVLARFHRLDPTYLARLRDAGWSRGAQIRLQASLLDKTDDELRAYMARPIDPVTAQPAPSIDNALGKALAEVLGGIISIEQGAAALAAQREAERLERERLEREKLENDRLERERLERERIAAMIDKAELEGSRQLSRLSALPDFGVYSSDPNVSKLVDDANAALRRMSTATSGKELSDLIDQITAQVTEAERQYGILKQAADQAEQEIAADRAALESVYTRVEAALNLLKSRLEEISQAQDDYPDDDANVSSAFSLPKAESEASDAITNGRRNTSLTKASIGALRTIEDSLNVEIKQAETKLAAIRSKPGNKPQTSSLGSSAVATALSQVFADVFGSPSQTTVASAPVAGGSAQVSTALDGAFKDVFG